MSNDIRAALACLERAGDIAVIEFCRESGVSLDAVELIRFLSRRAVQQRHNEAYGGAPGKASQA